MRRLLAVALVLALSSSQADSRMVVSRGVLDDKPLNEAGYSLAWNYDDNSVEKPENVAKAVKLVFDCAEQPLFGKPVTKIDYSWKGSRQLTVGNGGGKEVGADELRIFYYGDGDQKTFGGGKPRLGLWVYGNGSGDRLMRCLPVDWKGWRYVELSSHDFESRSGRLWVFELARGDQSTEERGPLYFGPGVFGGEIGEPLAEPPASPWPFPLYLARDESLGLQVGKGEYDVEIALDKRVTDGETPEVYLNDFPANGNSGAETIKTRYEAKGGFISLRCVCAGHWFSGVKHIRISQRGRTVAYCDASILKQTRRLTEINSRSCYVLDAPVNGLETAGALFERELGGKQLAADPRIVYQFKMAAGEYRVRLRFNRWRGTYPEAAKFDVFIQGDKVMEMRGPNKELLAKDFAVKVAGGYLQVALLGASQDACAWLGDISVFQDGKMLGFVQPRPDVPEGKSGDYLGLRNLVPNPSFEVVAWQRNWTALSPTSKPVRTSAAARHGDWSLCLGRTVGPGGLTLNNECAATIAQKSCDGSLAKVSKDEKFGEAYYKNFCGAPIDYTKTYRFTGWAKPEHATGQTYLQIVWVAGPRRTLEAKPLIPGSPKYRKPKFYFSVLGVSESARLGGSQEWQQLSLEATPPYGATHANFILRSDDNQGKVYFDGLDFDGFGTEPLEIVFPQAGYHSNGGKLAFVKSREPLAGGRFHLAGIDGETVFSGELEPLGLDPWGIHLSRADFSGYEGKGHYTLSVAARGLRGCSTPGFTISPSLYRDLGMLSVAGFFHVQRCGFEVPGWHPACHLDDAAIRNGVDWCGKQSEYFDPKKPKGEIVKHVDLAGGWHDAGSLDKYGKEMSTAVINFCRFWEDTHFASNELKEKYPDTLSEAHWAVDYIMRSIDKKEGKIYDQPIEWNPVTKGYDCLCSDPTDNIINTADDRICREAQNLNVVRNYTSILPVALTRFAASLREYDQERAKALLDTAGLWKADGNFALAMARYLANGRQDGDLRLIERMAAQTFSAYSSAKHPNILANDFLLLFDYVEIAPDGKLKDGFAALVRGICDEMLKPLADTNPYAVVDQMGEPVMTRAFSPAQHFSNHASTGISPCKYLQTAYFLVRAGTLLDDPELVKLGERHVQYVLGRNPHGLSMVGGTGARVYNMATMLYPYGSKWLELKGQIPGSVGSLYAVSDGSRNWIQGLAPLDFPVPQTASGLVDTYTACGEVHDVPSSWFVAVCGALDKALKKPRGHGWFSF